MDKACVEYDSARRSMGVVCGTLHYAASNTYTNQINARLACRLAILVIDLLNQRFTVGDDVVCEFLHGIEQLVYDTLDIVDD